MSTLAEEMQEARPSDSSPSAVVARLQLSVHSLSNRVRALACRCAASQAFVAERAPLVAFVAVGREAAFDCGVLASCVGKALESAAEEARAQAAQLEASALVLEAEAVEEGGESEGMSVAAAARALLSCDDCDISSILVVDWDSATALSAVDVALRVRDSVDRSLCIVRGDGALFYSVGDNSVTVVAVDGEGDVVESIEAEDVCVSVEGARLASVSVGEVGVVEVVYHVPEGRVEPVCVSASVCGAVLPGSPWTVIASLLGDSAILASVAPERIAAFLRELSVWLPRRAYTLLYRGSRDGMTAAAFHRLCDGKRPTLVLVRCDKGWVFGGHAGASWKSPPGGGTTVGSGDAFLFSVTGPHTSAPVRFPVKADKASEALYCHAGWGPAFYGGFVVRARSGMSAARFDERSSCQIGQYYDDVIGQEESSLTGHVFFLPVEVEVYAISHY